MRKTEPLSERAYRLAERYPDDPEIELIAFGVEMLEVEREDERRDYGEHVRALRIAVSSAIAFNLLAIILVQYAHHWIK